MDPRVAIVGAGPAGLVLSLLLHRAGIESVVLESRSREYVERRVRAGVLEQGTVDLLDDLGVADRLHREGLVHRGIVLRFAGEDHRIPLSDLTGGRAITVYGQQEVVKDLIAARLGDRSGADPGDPILFEAEALAVDPEMGRIRYRHRGIEREIVADIVAGCDGGHGVCRGAIQVHLEMFEKEYPFAWLGILARAAPAHDELIYSAHERGFALHSMRTPAISRLYLQVRPSERIEEWPDERIWAELQHRFARPGFRLNEGPILERSITPMRSAVCEPMQHERLYLAGDAAHIVPATGAKGLNLAVADVRTLAAALIAYFAAGEDSGLASYSATCLRRVWRAEQFSAWMTAMLHRPEAESPFERRLRESQLRYVVTSRAAATTLAENYVGYEWPQAGLDALAGAGTDV